MTFAAFDSNGIVSLPNLTCWTNVQQLQLQSNSMKGSLPDDLWQRLPSITTLILSDTLLNGTIPDRDSTLNPLFSFLAANCSFSGRLPRNIDSDQFDLSGNRFSGELVLFDARFVGESTMTSLTLSGAGALSCPIDLTSLTGLVSLNLRGNGFAGCDWTNVSISLLSRLAQLDISDNEWLPFDLMIPATAVAVNARQASVQGISVLGPDGSLLSFPALTTLVLDGSALNPHSSSDGDSVSKQLSLLLNPSVTPVLSMFSCQWCGLSLPLTSLFRSPTVQVLQLANNDLFDGFPPPSVVSQVQFSYPPLTVLSIANNTRIRGRLPFTQGLLQTIQSFDFEGTSLTGSIPASWSELAALTQVNIANTSVRCNLIVTAESQLQCAVQPVLDVSPTITIAAVSLADPAAGVHCSAQTIVATGSAGVTADPASHGFTLCSCDSGSFGVHARCYRCPDGCSCTADRIANCFPVVRRGHIAVSAQVDAAGARPVLNGSIAPFAVDVVLPCPRTVTGSSMCNPDGVVWPRFYRIIEATSGSALSDSDAASLVSDTDLTGWCYPGHTGRLCAACAPAYFSSGRWCLKCLSEGLHILILCATLLLIIALVAYLYAKSPNATTAAKSLRLYLSRLAQITDRGAGSRSRSMQLLQRGEADPNHFDAASFSSDPLAEPTPDRDAANPLKLLIFHAQQLSLLLHTSTSLPVVMSGLLSFVGSASTGFSLSSLVAMECLSSGWTLAARCWMAVFAPAIIGLVALVTALSNRNSGGRPRTGPALQLQGRDKPLLAADSDAAGPASSSIVPRIYSVCVSLLYFLFFPCAQAVLSAVSCTDTRESDRSYLNLYPDQACDDQWRHSVLPPAVLGLVFWTFAFPVGSTLLLMRLRSRVAASAAVLSPSASASTPCASSLSVWPVCADLLLPYSPRFWYFEQLLLMRRWMLVAAVTIIPATSLYLPLVLFSIIQLSALHQHWSHPYAHPLLNVGELASLYLLLLNYISALILQTGLVEGGFHATADGWAAALFVVNLAFLLLLVAGLFGWARQRIASRLSARPRPQRL